MKSGTHQLLWVQFFEDEPYMHSAMREAVKYAASKQQLVLKDLIADPTLQPDVLDKLVEQSSMPQDRALVDARTAMQSLLHEKSKRLREVRLHSVGPAPLLSAELAVHTGVQWQ